MRAVLNQIGNMELGERNSIFPPIAISPMKIIPGENMHTIIWFLNYSHPWGFCGEDNKENDKRGEVRSLPPALHFWPYLFLLPPLIKRRRSWYSVTSSLAYKLLYLWHFYYHIHVARLNESIVQYNPMHVSSSLPGPNGAYSQESE